MQIVRDLNDESLAEESIAVAILSTDIERRHLGIFFREDGKLWQMIHLGWHGYFRISAPEPRYCSVKIGGVDPVILDGMADWLPEVLSANDGHMAYSIKPTGDEPLNEDGKARFMEPGDGFTCATFVMAVFNRWKIPLISLQGWTDRPDDAKWREWILDKLQETQTRFNIPQAHIDAQKPYVDHAARFRPEEVAGAAGEWQGRASTFPEAESKGELVLDEMDKLRLLIKYRLISALEDCSKPLQKRRIFSRPTQLIRGSV